MRKAVTFTSTLSPELIAMLNDYSVKLNTPKNQLLSIALKNYINELKRQEYINSFQRAKLDSEIRELSEDGIEDFLEIISK